MSLHPTIIKTRNGRDHREWSVVHKNPNHRGSVHGGRFAKGVVRGLSTRQARGLIAAMGRQLRFAYCKTPGCEVIVGRFTAAEARRLDFNAPNAAPENIVEQENTSASVEVSEENDPAFVEPNAADVVEPPALELEKVRKLTKNKISKLAADHGVEIPTNIKKSEMLDRLVEHAGSDTYAIV